MSCPQHLFRPHIWLDDNQVLGTDELGVSLDKQFVIVQCLNCGKQGFVYSKSNHLNPYKSPQIKENI